MQPHPAEVSASVTTLPACTKPFGAISADVTAS
jgi:hypothetical protein